MGTRFRDQFEGAVEIGFVGRRGQGGKGQEDRGSGVRGRGRGTVRARATNGTS